MSDSKLWEAALFGQEALVSQYIQQGAEVDWRNRDLGDWTALHYAAYGG